MFGKKVKEKIANWNERIDMKFTAPDDINDAQKIIIDFVTEFEDLYGTKAMTSNLHGHLHLPRQVRRFGPLNKISCFPFENVFKITRNILI